MVDLVDIDLSLCPEFIEISTVSALSCRVHCLFTRPKQGAYRATIFQLHRVLKDLDQRFPTEGGRFPGYFKNQTMENPSAGRLRYCSGAAATLSDSWRVRSR